MRPKIRGPAARLQQLRILLDNQDFILLKFLFQFFFQPLQKLSGQARFIGQYPKNNDFVSKSDVTHLPKTFIFLGEVGQAIEKF